MPNAQDFLREQPRFLCLINGMPDSGKSDLAMTFPGCYVLTFDPTGFQILRGSSNRAQQLAANLVHIEPGSDIWTAALFNRTIGSPSVPVTSADRQSIYGCFAHVAEMAKAGAIQTLILDGYNYLVGEKWMRICKDPVNIASSGELDRFAAYRSLKLFLDEFTWRTLLPLATRNKLNLIVTCHVKRENPETVTGILDKLGNKKTGGKVSHDSDLAPIIEGSFRHEIDGKFGAVIFLEHKPGTKQVERDGRKVNVATMQYFAYCQKVAALDTVVNAKNKYGLPAKLDITDKSFYEILMSKVAQPELKASTEAAK